MKRELRPRRHYRQRRWRCPLWPQLEQDDCEQTGTETVTHVGATHVTGAAHVAQDETLAHPELQPRFPRALASLVQTASRQNVNSAANHVFIEDPPGVRAFRFLKIHSSDAFYNAEPTRLSYFYKGRLLSMQNLSKKGFVDR